MHVRSAQRELGGDPGGRSVPTVPIRELCSAPAPGLTRAALKACEVATK